MNKSELVDSVARESGLTKADSQRALNATLDVITNALAEGDTVSLIGFSTFLVRERAARTGRNAATGETIKIKSSKTPAFKSGNAITYALNYPAYAQGCLAQLGEHRPYKARVGGSSAPAPTRIWSGSSVG